ncbi:uncharacterized protein [Clytia hemisphaerica]
MREIKNKKKKDLPDYLQEIFAKQSEVNHSKVKASLSRRKIPFTVSNTVTMKPPSEYLRNEHGVYFCEDITKDCFYCQRETLATSSLKDMVLYYKNNSFPCKVVNKVCLSCHKELPYDGLDDSIINMEKFLIHHTVLRDYMFHFLNGNSCTMFSYYEVMMAVQKDSGDLELKKRFSYNNFRSSWYAYLKLLDVSFTSSADCDKCGKVPDIVVCDATGMGFQKKFLASGLCDTVRSKPIQRYSKHGSRLAIDDAPFRKRFRRWLDGKMNPAASQAFRKDLQNLNKQIHKVIEWGYTKYQTDSRFPKAFKDVLRLFASASPVCSYFPPNEDSTKLSMKMLDENVKADSETMRQIQEVFPLFHSLLSILPCCLPGVWKGLLLYLYDKANDPFINASVINTPKHPKSAEISSFPNLPKLRKRGFFEMDFDKTKQKDCRKNHTGHRNLTSGIFTLYCQHGVCLGYQIMAKKESPDVPFTIFRTRFPKAPGMIIYDNACNLHTYALNRDPLFFQHTKFVVDRFHWRNHTACSFGYCMKLYSTMQHINSEVNEQENSRVKKLKTQLAYMTPENFIRHCDLFFWHRNQKRMPF